MKLITAIIQPHCLDRVKDSLQKEGVQGITVSEAQGFGRQKGHTEFYRGAQYTIDLIPKVRVEIVVNDPDLDRIVDCIIKSSQSGNIGDGKIWITNVENIIRIRTSEQGIPAM